ncbi:Tn7-like element transposition protein TnsE [Brevibacillus sp. SYSU BS000544]|uniref:Tn7-like element transposition protein TnsE n=1 Tax=Brevibacillus sp. SYSU BS000544 TaxID=3416443 RepID=UPI003CE59C04
MSSLKLRPWKFPKAEVVELYWFCSPYRDVNGNWMLPVAFKRKTNEIKILHFSWGILPALRLGQKYIDGLAISTKKGTISSVEIPNAEQGQICSSFDMPPELYFLYRNQELGTQKVWKRSVGEYDYYIPCVEIIRSMLATSRTLAHQLLQPNGLELIIDQIRIFDSELHIYLSKEFPKSLINEKNVLHLVWLYFNKFARTVWDSTYTNLVKGTIGQSENSFANNRTRNIPLETVFPIVGKSQITFRGIQAGKSILVMEFIGVTGFDVRFNKIVYSHPLLKRNVEIERPQKSRIVTQISEEKGFILNDNSESSKINSHQDVLELMATLHGYQHMPDMKINRVALQEIGIEPSTKYSQGRGGRNEHGRKEVSTHDSMYGGDTSPIEFDTLLAVPIFHGLGLESFFKLIHYMQKEFPQIRISMGVVQLPLGKRFSICPDGNRRTCAIVCIESEGRLPTYILEIARPDDWSISTLLFSSIKPLKPPRIENYIQNLLKSLVEKGGHWDRDAFDQCIELHFKKVKHIKPQSLDRWTERIMSKVNS